MVPAFWNPRRADTAIAAHSLSETGNDCTTGPSSSARIRQFVGSGKRNSKGTGIDLPRRKHSSEFRGRVDLDGCPPSGWRAGSPSGLLPKAPTDPDVRITRIGLVTSRIRWPSHDPVTSR